MEIRSITLFCEPDYPTPKARAFFEDASANVLPAPLQTRRVALPPFPTWWNPTESMESQADAVTVNWRAAGAEYVSLGPVQLQHEASWLAHIPQLLGHDAMLFASAEIAKTDGHVDPSRCRAVAAIIRSASTILDNGFGNLYFSALAHCTPSSPFFPVAYHAGGRAGFALAVEAADLAVDAFTTADTLQAARQGLVSAIEAAASALSDAAASLAEKHDLVFQGIDFSLAPFPEQQKSLGQALELLGLPWIGAPGSLFTATLVADAIDRARFPRCGFSGLMLPVLEDAVLALRAAEGRLTVYDLLSYAAVCGTGLDTIPLPGDISETTLAAILMDVAALATRLNKPLTARLMPLPNLRAGDPIQFEFPYFADSCVMGVPDHGLTGPLQGAKELRIAGLRERWKEEQ